MRDGRRISNDLAWDLLLLVCGEPDREPASVEFDALAWSRKIPVPRWCKAGEMVPDPTRVDQILEILVPLKTSGSLGLPRPLFVPGHFGSSEFDSKRKISFWPSKTCPRVERSEFRSDDGIRGLVPLGPWRIWTVEDLGRAVDLLHLEGRQPGSGFIVDQAREAIAWLS